MKNITKLLNLLTAFLAIIGICTASLVCFIVVYTQIKGGFSPKHTTNQDVIVTQTNNNVVGAFSYNTDSNENSTFENLYDDDVNNNYNNTEPIPMIENQSSNEVHEQPNYEYVTASAVPETNYDTNSEANDTSNSAIYTIPIEQETFGTDFIADTHIQSTDIYNSNENNFNTYNTPEQHQTIDTYVLNTNPDRMKIHYPTCRDVKKISPENYSTSSLSISELYAQGYTTCGHCFR